MALLNIPLFTDWRGIDSASDVTSQVCDDIEHFQQHIKPGLERAAAQEAAGGFFGVGAWFLDILTPDLELEPVGLVSLDLITSAGAAYVASSWAGAAPLTALNALGVGTGSTTPIAGDTELEAELEAVNAGTRTTATVSLPIANRVRLQGTTLYTGDDLVVVRELGVFNTVTFGSGVMFDRALCPTTPLAPFTGMSLTFMLTLNAG
jgi:hypothetical protein